MFIKYLSDINCISAETFGSIKIVDFDIKQFLKDYPTPDKDTLSAFMDGKTQFFRLFLPKEMTDFHVHFLLRIEPTKSSQNVRMTIEFCKEPKHTKHKKHKPRSKKSFSYFDEFFTWLSKYISNFSKVDIYSNIGYAFDTRKYNSIFKLPFSLDVSSSEMGFKGIDLSGFRLKFRDSNIGVEDIEIQTDEKLIFIFVNGVIKRFDLHYFDAIFESTSKLTKIFVKELKNEVTV
jgi:hypothetical protein